MTALCLGQSLPVFQLAPLTRTTLALYCGASGDHHPLHVDIDWVRQHTDMEDVIGHGMLTMAYVGRFLTAHCKPEDIVELICRFQAPSRIGDRLRCVGKVATERDYDMGHVFDIDLTVFNQDETILLTGKATIRPPSAKIL